MVLFVSTNLIRKAPVGSRVCVKSVLIPQGVTSLFVQQIQVRTPMRKTAHAEVEGSVYCEYYRQLHTLLLGDEQELFVRARRIDEKLSMARL